MRGELLLKALEFFSDAASGTGQFLEAFLASNKNDYRALRYGPSLRPQVIKREAVERQRFYNLLYRLERDGLITKKSEGRRSNWIITSKGEKKQKGLLARLRRKLPDPHYNNEPDDVLTIISFDIPEKERRKRVWLRSALLNLNFRILQKSVWIGKVKVPKEFLENLKQLHLIPYIEIFAISKRGSIRHIA